MDGAAGVSAEREWSLADRFIAVMAEVSNH